MITFKYNDHTFKIRINLYEILKRGAKQRVRLTIYKVILILLHVQDYPGIKISTMFVL